ncbi:MAG: hypothetical protein V9G08_09200 [Dermatophilaceae bacterium]
MGPRHGDLGDEHRRDPGLRLTTGHRVDPPQAAHPLPTAAAHPLSELQRSAGNAAVAALVAVQRHALVPEEEAGS